MTLLLLGTVSATQAEPLEININTSESLTVSCGDSGTAVLNFGTIGRSSSYDGSGSVVIEAEMGAKPSTQNNQFLLDGSGGVLACVVTREVGTSSPLTVTLSAGYKELENNTIELKGHSLASQSLSATLTLRNVGTTIYVGGNLSIKSKQQASAQLYVSQPITLTVSE
jgi:hypothetical protein